MNMKTASKKTHRTKLRVGHDMGTAVMAGLPRFNFSPRNLEGTKLSDMDPFRHLPVQDLLIANAQIVYYEEIFVR